MKGLSLVCFIINLYGCYIAENTFEFGISAVCTIIWILLLLSDPKEVKNDI